MGTDMKPHKLSPLSNIKESSRRALEWSKDGTRDILGQDGLDTRALNFPYTNITVRPQSFYVSFVVTDQRIKKLTHLTEKNVKKFASF